MLDIEAVLGLQGSLFLMISLGWIAGRKGLLSKECRKGFSDILIYIVSPCNIIGSFRQDITGELMRQSVAVIV